MKKNTKKGISKTKIIGIGAGIAAVGAGAYYLLGPKAEAHQKKASKLFLEMKKEVQSEIKKASEMTTPLYEKTVDLVSKNYAKQYKIHEKDIKAFSKKLKDEWKHVRGN